MGEYKKYISECIYIHVYVCIYIDIRRLEFPTMIPFIANRHEENHSTGLIFSLLTMNGNKTLSAYMKELM